MMGRIVNNIHHGYTSRNYTLSLKKSNIFKLVLVISSLLIVTLWSYWPTILSLYKEWQSNDDYSAGQLVPLVAIFLIWRIRKKLKLCRLKPFWLGLAIIVLAQMGRIYGLLFMFESVERYSLVLSIAGLVLMVLGWQIFRQIIWILLFLFLMVPFPGRVHNIISAPLQKMATTGSVFILEVFMKIGQQGNILILNEDTSVGIIEACSGLRMLTAFIIVTAFITYMVKCSGLKKTLLLFSSIPVAIICNILRIVVTVVLMLCTSVGVAEKFFHDFAGIVMMPAAVLLIFGELWLMEKLVIPESNPQKIYGKKET